MLTPTEFCERFDACPAGRTWARTCSDMPTVWNAARPEWLIWIATRDGVATLAELRKFCAMLARAVLPPRSLAPGFRAACDFMDVAAFAGRSSHTGAHARALAGTLSRMFGGDLVALETPYSDLWAARTILRAVGVHAEAAPPAAASWEVFDLGRSFYRSGKMDVVAYEWWAADVMRTIVTKPNFDLIERGTLCATR